jgi:hypothetical protein
MRFLLMINVPHGTGAFESNEWSDDDVKAHMSFLGRLNRELTDSGELVALAALTPPREARTVRASRHGAIVTDGPFPESKEFLAGYWMVDVPSPERAYEIAAKASAAPGPGGEPLYLAIEVRAMQSSPPIDPKSA